MPNKITAWSYSRLACWESCPAQHNYRNILKLDEPKGAPLLEGIKIHNQIEKYLTGKVEACPIACLPMKDMLKDLRELKPIVEERWSFTKDMRKTTWMARNVYLRVVLDAALIYEDATADVIDHKTGKFRPNDATYADQMGLFAACTFIKFQDLHHITTRLWFVEHNEEVIAEYERSHAAEVLIDLTFRAEQMMADTDFPATPSWKCRWCHFRKDNGGPCEFSGD